MVFELPTPCISSVEVYILAAPARCNHDSSAEHDQEYSKQLLPAVVDPGGGECKGGEESGEGGWVAVGV